MIDFKYVDKLEYIRDHAINAEWDDWDENYLTGKWIPKEELIDGQVYMCDARNFTLGVWNGDVFEYLRYKFGTTFPDTECHWDDGPPHGTVKPYKPYKAYEI